MLLQHVSGGGPSRFGCYLGHTQHAYLWQHCISGRPLLPGVAMLEAAYAAAGALLPDESVQQLTLQGAAIAAPLLLRPPSAGSGEQLSADVACSSGEVQLVSQLGSGAPTLHLSAGAAVFSTGHAVRPALEPSGSLLVRSILQRQLLAAVPAHWRGEALGSLCRQLLPVTDSYHCHPVMADAATHFGAAFDLDYGSAPRVPVGLGSYIAQTADEPGGATVHSFTAAAAGQLQADGTRVSSFSITDALSLGSLCSRPLGSKPTLAAHAVAAAKAFEQQNFAYAIEWQAAASAVTPYSSASSQLLLARSSSLCLQGDAAALPAARQLVLVPRTCRPSNPAAAAAEGIEMLQRILAAGGSAAVHAFTAAASSTSPTASRDSSSSAMLAALLKVAAVENPARQWLSLAADPQQPLQLRQHGFACSADQQGAELAAGMFRHPKLLRHAM